MTKVLRSAFALLVGLGLTVAVASTASAQELPTGAARVVGKVELQATSAKARLLAKLAPIRPAAESKAP